MVKRKGKRLTWKTIPIASYDDLRRLQGAWGSSKGAFGEGRTFDIRSGGVLEVETDIPISGLRDLFRHAGVRLDTKNGIAWADRPLAEEPELEEPGPEERARMRELAERSRARRGFDVRPREELLAAMEDLTRRIKALQRERPELGPGTDWIGDGSIAEPHAARRALLWALAAFDCPPEELGDHISIARPD